MTSQHPEWGVDPADTTVEGWNPVPVDTYFVSQLFFQVFSTSQLDLPLTQDASHQQDCYIFNRESLETFISMELPGFRNRW